MKEQVGQSEIKVIVFAAGCVEYRRNEVAQGFAPQGQQDTLPEFPDVMTKCGRKSYCNGDVNECERK
jgi:hypothetical protein